MYVRNRSGPNTVRCGTPEVTNVGVEKEPSTEISYLGMNQFSDGSSHYL